MVCPYCGHSTRVSNSRTQKRNNQVWRRRICKGCKSTFTTHESIFLPDIFMVDKQGLLEPFEPTRLIIDLSEALKHRGDGYTAARELTSTVVNNLRLELKDKPVISAEKIAVTTAEVLKNFDRRAWRRFSADYSYLED